MCMNSNEDIFLNSFILESQNYTDEQLRESLNTLSNISKQKLVEKVQEFDTNAKLTLENKTKLMKALTDFINDLTKVVEAVEDRSKHSNEIKELKGMIETAESIKKRLDSDTIRTELKEPLKLKTSISKGDNK